MYFISVILFSFFFHISHSCEYAGCSPVQLMQLKGFCILILWDLNFHILHILMV